MVVFKSGSVLLQKNQPETLSDSREREREKALGMRRLFCFNLQLSASLTTRSVTTASHCFSMLSLQDLHTYYTFHLIKGHASLQSNPHLKSMR